MARKQSAIKSACEQVLIDFAETQPDWKYIKSRRSFVRTVSKLTFVDIYTGMISKVEFVNFQFSLHGGHKYVSQVDPLRTANNWAIIWHGQNWLDRSLKSGRYTVYDHHDPYAASFDELRAEGDPKYVRLEDFPARLATVFERAEAEIDRIFDISSESALIRSWIDKPVGYFRGADVLRIQLMLGNPDYLDELLQFYDRPNEEVFRPRPDIPHRIDALKRSHVETMMEQYRRGEFPHIELT